jgi:ATP-binding cassette, subfamily D (ALD), peroxisomal long-chain fatty acid import protein
MLQLLMESKSKGSSHSCYLLISTRIVASLVRKEPLQFLFNIIRWLLVAIPATWTNSWLSYVQNKLAIAYRTRLTQEVMKQYLGDEEGPDGKVYYKLCMCVFLR